jgi:SAM-dependent methyltransferase
MLLDANFDDEAVEELYSLWYPRATRKVEEFQPPREIPRWKSWLDGERASAFRWVPPGVRVLDIGCGFGETLAYHEARGCEAHGIDPDENLLRAADAYGLKVRVGLFDPTYYQRESFDYVTLDQVIEHAIDPLALMSGIGQVLRPGGKVVLSTPNPHGYGARLFRHRWINWHVPYHIHQFSRRSLNELALRSGFRTLTIRTVTSSKWIQYQDIHLRSRPPEGTPSPYFDPERSPLVVPARALWLARRGERYQVFRIISRLTDALGIGDNYVSVFEKPRS